MNQLSPRAARSLRARRSPLSDPATQLALLEALELPDGDFEDAVRAAGHDGLYATALRVMQLNLGKLCNMACRHCHVDAGPDRTTENMSAETVDACIAAIDRVRPQTVDLTGGAPELNKHFRRLVTACAERGLHVIDRCNLSVLLLGSQSDLTDFLAQHKVEVVASLPHPRARSTDAQRGDGAFRRSITALRKLNQAGYGHGDPDRCLTLMHNPSGAFLPGGQASMERDWKRTLERDHDVRFDRLIALTNMPISRFLEWLDDTDNLQPYMERLVERFNSATLGGLMCRDTVSVGWDGRLYDCDFNQMLAIDPSTTARHVSELSAAAWSARRVRTARHCFGCTAGAGSSCAGSTS